jgi:hypothetical protein
MGKTSQHALHTCTLRPFVFLALQNTYQRLLRSHPYFYYYFKTGSKLGLNKIGKQNSCAVNTVDRLKVPGNAIRINDI